MPHQLPFFIDDSQEFLTNVFKSLHGELSNSHIDTFVSGTTLTMAIICKDVPRLIVANVGDCRMISGRFDEDGVKALELTR